MVDLEDLKQLVQNIGNNTFITVEGRCQFGSYVIIAISHHNIKHPDQQVICLKTILGWNLPVHVQKQQPSEWFEYAEVFMRLTHQLYKVKVRDSFLEFNHVA